MMSQLSVEEFVPRRRSKQDKEGDDRYQRAIALIGQRKGIILARTNIASELGLEPSSGVAIAVVGRLVEDGFLRDEGFGKYTCIGVPVLDRAGKNLADAKNALNEIPGPKDDGEFKRKKKPIVRKKRTYRARQSLQKKTQKKSRQRKRNVTQKRIPECFIEDPVMFFTMARVALAQTVVDEFERVLHDTPPGELTGDPLKHFCALGDTLSALIKNPA